MTLRQLEAFVKIADNSSFTLAARELFITQPTVSAYIGNLEDELGVRLFIRTTKEVMLSEEGEKIYPYAKEMVKLARKIKSAFSGADAGVLPSQLVISTSTIPGQYLLPGILSQFSRRCPDVRLRVIESDSEGVINDIAEHRADIGFAGTMAGTEECEFVPFYDDELIIVTPNSEKYREIKAKERDLNWVADEGFIMRERGSGTRREAVRGLQEAGIDERDIKVKATFNNTGAIISSVRSGVGIAVISRLAAEEEISRGTVLGFRLSENGSFRKIYMVSCRMYPLSAAAKAMTEVVHGMYLSE